MSKNTLKTYLNCPDLNHFWTFFNEQQLNMQANAPKKTIVWKVGSIPFKHATELTKASNQSIWQCTNKLRKDILSLE